MIERVIKCDRCGQRFPAKFHDDDPGGMPEQSCPTCGSCLCGSCLPRSGCKACEDDAYLKDILTTAELGDVK